MPRTLMALVLIPFLLAACGDGSPGGSGAPGDGAGGAAAAPGSASGADWREDARRAVARGADYLLEHATDGRWAFKPELGPDAGITGLAALAVIQADGAHLARIRPGLEWLRSEQGQDGSIGMPATYATAAAVQAFAASGVEAFRPAIERGRDYLVLAQNDEGEGVEPSSEGYGGFGYGDKTGKPNLSTAHFAIDAVDAAGLPKDHDFYRKALVFLEKVQNRTESNPGTFELDGVTVTYANDGGAIYEPGSSKAGWRELPDGRRVLASYGSMSYALLKSYLLCDLDARDPRVRSLLAWLGENWALDHNPGMEHLDAEGARQMGLYYYYLAAARSLREAARRDLELDGDLTDWRAALARAVLERQNPDGSWSNPQPRWWEGHPTLATAYALLALEACLE